LRISFGRSFLLRGRDWQVTFEPGPQCAWRTDENTMTVTMDSGCANGFSRAVQPRQGKYKLPDLPSLTWNVEQTLIRNADGDVVQKIG
jgi:suppressor of fused-like protein